MHKLKLNLQISSLNSKIRNFMPESGKEGSFEKSEEPKEKKQKMNKTPISILTELCTQKKVNQPTFAELDVTAQNTHNSSFKFFIKCSAFGKSASAGGVTKKGAKHTAAEILLKKINSSYDSSDDEDMPNMYCSTDFVSDLLNLCVQKNFHKPEFILTESYGPTHSPTFTFECRLNTIRRQGSASNKQLAKKLAAKGVLDVLKLSYPDQEKKVMLINDENMAKEEARRKITSYLELKNCNKTDKMGTLLSNRHKFFIEYKDEDFISALKAILCSDNDLITKYRLFVEELKTEWEYNVGRFVETDLNMFEVLIDFDQFTVNLIAENGHLEETVIDYFMNMLHLVPKSNYSPGIALSADQLVLIPLGNL